MADVEALAAAVEALFPANVRPFFGHVPDGTTLPWTFVLTSLPSPTERRMCGRISNRRCVVRVRITAANDLAVRRVADNLLPALEDVRPSAAGWQTTPLRQLGDDPRVYPDSDTTVADGGHPLICAVDFEFMATESA